MLQVQNENQQNVSLPYVSRIVYVYIEYVSMCVINVCQVVLMRCVQKCLAFPLDHGFDIRLSLLDCHL